MRLLFFDSHAFERDVFTSVNTAFGHDLHFLENRLHEQTVKLAEGHKALCCFVNDKLNAKNLKALKSLGVDIILL